MIITKCTRIHRVQFMSERVVFVYNRVKGVIYLKGGLIKYTLLRLELSDSDNHWNVYFPKFVATD